jgi:hypothetical protein
MSVGVGYVGMSRFATFSVGNVFWMEPIDLSLHHAAMGNSAAKLRSPVKKPPFVKVTAEDGDHVAPPPPEIVEPDPDLIARRSRAGAQGLFVDAIPDQRAGRAG